MPVSASGTQDGLAHAQQQATEPADSGTASFHLGRYESTSGQRIGSIAGLEDGRGSDGGRTGAWAAIRPEDPSTAHALKRVRARAGAVDLCLDVADQIGLGIEVLDEGQRVVGLGRRCRDDGRPARCSRTRGTCWRTGCRMSSRRTTRVKYAGTESRARAWKGGLGAEHPAAPSRPLGYIRSEQPGTPDSGCRASSPHLSSIRYAVAAGSHPGFHAAITRQGHG